MIFFFLNIRTLTMMCWKVSKFLPRNSRQILIESVRITHNAVYIDIKYLNSKTKLPGFERFCMLPSRQGWWSIRRKCSRGCAALHSKEVTNVKKTNIEGIRLFTCNFFLEVSYTFHFVLHIIFWQDNPILLACFS